MASTQARQQRDHVPHAALSTALCETVSAWRFEDLPAGVVQAVKLLLLDTLGVIAGAARAPGIAELNATLARWEPAGTATGLIGKRGYSPPTAALANGAAAHALDFDDQHDPARVHACCVMLPAVLATAQDDAPLDGRAFLLALAAGAEIDARLGLACYNCLGQGWHPSTLLGALAGGIACARARGLDAGRTRDALGIAFHQACGSAQAIADGALTKRLGPGFAARNAVTAAALAQSGVTGAIRPLEGDAGLFALHARGEARPGVVLDRLGSDWLTAQYSIKPYPCCRCKHSAIALGADLHRQGIRPAELVRAEIRMGKVDWQTVGAPYEPARDSVVHAQFNAAYGFARALADGKVDLRSYTRPHITDSAIAALAARVRVIADESMDATAIGPVRIRLELTGGRVLETASDTIKGSPQAPLTEREVLDKLDGCLEFGLGATRAQGERLADAVMRIEREQDAAAAIVAAFPGA